MSVTKNFVTFLYPGSFVAEEITAPIGQWDPAEARVAHRNLEIAHQGRLGKPICFYFTTRTRGDEDLDSHECGRSGKYYVNCVVYSLSEIRDRNDRSDSTLVLNMEGNGWSHVVTPRRFAWYSTFDAAKDQTVEW